MVIPLWEIYVKEKADKQNGSYRHAYTIHMERTVRTIPSKKIFCKNGVYRSLLDLQNRAMVGLLCRVFVNRRRLCATVLTIRFKFLKFSNGCNHHHNFDSSGEWFDASFPAQAFRRDGLHRVGVFKII